MTQSNATGAGWLNGRHVAVAGSTGKIGGHIARGLVAAGAVVAALGRSESGLQRLLETVEAGRDRLLPVAADLSTPEGAQGAAAAAAAAIGPIDGVVDAVGRFTMGSLLTDPLSVWETALEDNLTVHIRLCRAFVPLLLAQAQVEASDAQADFAPTLTLVMGLAGETPNPAAGGMAVTGAAEAMLARVLVREVGPRGVCVNGVVLGPIATSQALAQGHPERVRGEDVAAGVVRLLAPGSRALHGSFVLLKERAAVSPGA